MRPTEGRNSCWEFGGCGRGAGAAVEKVCGRHLKYSYKLGFTSKNCPKVQQNRFFSHLYRDQARGRLGRNSCPRGQNFALNGTQGEVEVSLKKKKKNSFGGGGGGGGGGGRLIFILSPHKCKLWWHYKTIYYHCIVILLPLNGNSMCNG